MTDNQEVSSMDLLAHWERYETARDAYFHSALAGYVSTSRLRSEYHAAREKMADALADTTHDGRWAAGRAESALVAMGVDPRLPGGQ